MPGMTFTPGNQNRPQGTGALQNGAEALRQISLRLPQTLGGSPIAPSALLTPSVGGPPSFLGLQQAFQPNPTPLGAPMPGPAAAPQAPVATPSVAPQQAPQGVPQAVHPMTQLIQSLFSQQQNPFNAPAQDPGLGQQQPPNTNPTIGFGGNQQAAAGPSPQMGIGPSSGFGPNLARGAY